MPVHVSADKMQKAEQQLLEFLKKIWTQTQEKKIWARIITAIVLIVAIFQELATDLHLTNGWKEITVYVIAGYFGIATYRNSFRFFTGEKDERTNSR